MWVLGPSFDPPLINPLPAYTTPEVVAELLTELKALGIHRIDTAARYLPTNPGASERLLGEARAAHEGFTIDTKILIAGDGAGSLEPAPINRSLHESYARLGLEETVSICQAPVNVLYCHGPDMKTPLEEQASGLDAQYRKGLFKQLGVSNFSAEMLEQFIAICEREGYLKPSVYQGQYNIVCCASEETLFPILRKHGIAFNAFSPLAGGFPTGRLTEGVTEGTRFDAGNVMGQAFRIWYDKPAMHDATHGISKVEACLRWVCFHSALGPGDRVILGASKPAQLAPNLAAIGNGRLPEEVVKAMDAIWASVA
ncbi:NADP-dependent oxidoreductase domain-containing protein [Mycena maculata]|uniref:NADP-dependent oxidoreductase domain-containing protein n=1 Tax=Mycena maculata TaxID=230809 RepID=A0AAD7IUK4_9AGAR|nr:NADP-dependent oxidoreductase domain-containing protein [Mycena maculata]